MRKLIAVLAVASFVVFACTKSSNEKQEAETKESLLNIAPEKAKADLQPLLDLRKELAQRVIGSGISKSDIQAALATKDFDKLRKQINMSDEEYNQYSDRLLSLQQSLVAKYPELQNAIKDKSECQSCDQEKINTFLASATDKKSLRQDLITQESYAVAASLPPVDEFEDVDDGAAGCRRWLAYTACLVVCTTTGPVIYWVCAALCVDTYCL